MPQFRYSAADQTGHLRKGLLRAANSMELEHALTAQGLELISERQVRDQHAFSRKLPRKELINFLLNLEQMTRAGVPLIEGLSDIRDSQPRGRFKNILASLIESVESGKTLSDAMLGFGTVFDHIVIALIKVGEETGHLPDVLADLADSLKWTDEIISHTKKIIIYPSIVGIVVFGVVCFLMIYLVPQLIPFIKEMGGEIPTQTKALIVVSNAFSSYWHIIIPTPFLAIFFLKVFAKSSAKARRAIDRFKLRIPVFGELIFKLKVARFSNYFALMYKSGISVLESLKICSTLFDNVILEEAVNQTRQSITDGNRISDSFKDSNMFPPLVLRMIRIGETTGALDTALQNISYFYNRDVKEAIGKIEPSLEPILTITMGGMMMWIMVSVLGPVYDIITQL